MARPTGFEPVTPAFGGQNRPFSRLAVLHNLLFYVYSCPYESISVYLFCTYVSTYDFRTMEHLLWRVRTLSDLTRFDWP